MSRMGLNRTGSGAYKRYLRSQQWGFRRVRWFRDERLAGIEPICQVCEITDTEYQQHADRSLDLHHLSYDGVIIDEEAGVFKAAEAHRDLMPFCRDCHQQLHQIMDRGKDFHGWDRENATLAITGYLRSQLASIDEEKVTH